MNHEIDRFGENSSPKTVNLFFAELARQLAPKSVLDPVCGVGESLQSVINAVPPGVQAEGIEINRECATTARALVGSEARIVCEDALQLERDRLGVFDLIVADPPLGARCDKKKIRDPEVAALTLGLPDLGVYLTAWGCMKLSENGFLSISHTTSALLRDKFKDAINKLGFAFRAAIHVPAGSRTNTGIATQILVLSRGEQTDSSFVIGEVSEDPDHLKSLVRNILKGKSGHGIAQGRRVNLEGFVGYEAVNAADRLQKFVRERKLSVIPFSELVIRRETLADVEAIPADGRSIYLPRGGHRFSTDLNDLSTVKSEIIRFELNPEKVVPRYLDHWFHSYLGKLAMGAAGGLGSFRPTVSLSMLDRMICYLPGVTEQQTVLNTVQYLDQLKNEIAEIEEACWDSKIPAAVLLEQAELVNKEDSFEDWLDTLPYPLATVLWLYRTTNDGPKEKFRILLHFFEALAQFLALVHLSAFSSHRSVWSDAKEGLKRALEKEHFSLERATFGAWKVMVEYLSSSTRKMLKDQDKAPVVPEMYASDNESWLNRLNDPRLVTILMRAVKIRNEQHGHSGIVGDKQAEAVESSLRDLVEEVREIFGRGWQSYELIQIGRMEYEAGTYTFDVPRLMGTRGQFRRVSLNMKHPLDKGCLCLHSEGADSALKLLPLLKLLGPPEHVENAVYFYSSMGKDQQRFVSYHFDKASEVRGQFDDTHAAIHGLGLTG
ncbi:MAG: N-6 DNA methylase [Pseudomonadota bacterium]|nr:N-6 DNA methylase [Pseudomonadota bacterium]